MKQTKHTNENVVITETTKFYEGNFLKNAMKKAKSFVKDTYRDVKRNAKGIIKDLKKKYSQSKKPENFIAGKMIAFQYKAKDATKKYDASPLVISLGYSQNPKYRQTHFIGLNCHWLPMNDRVKISSFFVELSEKRNGKLLYSDVKPFLSKFKGHPVLRQYIIKNVGPKVIEMPSDVFMTAAAVPSENWMGGR